MTSKAFEAIAYLDYLRRSRTRHSVHSPFVYQLVENVFRNKQQHQALEKIEDLRHRLSYKSQMIEITDFGAGSKHRSYEHRFERISAIAAKSSVNEKYGRLLFRLVEYFRPEKIIELGTSLGISALFMAMANPDAHVFTAEGCTTKSEQALANFRELKVKNIDLHIGRFDLILPDLIKKAGKLDFAYIDGNHTFEATLYNFKTLMEIAHNDTIFVFDDIHWSAAMEQAWSKISDHKDVTVSIDLFRLGIVFLKKELSPQKFVIRF